MTQPNDIEALRKVAEEAISAYPYVRYQFAAQNADVERTRATRYAKAIAKRVARALLSELEAVKRENARLFEANVTIREQQKEDFTRAQAAEAALEAVKGERDITAHELATWYASDWKARALAAEAALVSLKGERGSSSVSLRAAPDGANEMQHSAGVEHLDPTRWEVTVHVDGTNVLTIGSHGYLAGYSEIDRFGDAVRAAGEHLLSFIGSGEPPPCFACGGSGQERWVGHGNNEEVGPVCGEGPEDTELPI